MHKGQGVTVDEGLLVVDHATSAEHLYVGLTRGRHHNQACVIAESAGDEHNRQEPPSAADVLSSALGRSSGEISATETLRAELDHPSQTSAPQASIIEGLRQAHLHGFHEAVRRQVHRQASDPANDIHALTPTVHGPGL